MVNIKAYHEKEDIMAAISTPIGEGGIGIVRMSGRGSINLAKGIFRSAKAESALFPSSHRLYYGHIIGENGEIVDEVLVSFMKPPCTYTTEEMVEINCHSGIYTLKMILDLVIKKGARIADPGEFTRRAFYNGRIDLSQAESILSIIQARSEKAAKAAVRQIAGELGNCIRKLREQIFNVLAEIEAAADFPEEILKEGSDKETIGPKIAKICHEVAELCRGSKSGRIYQDGLRLAIAGRTNVGKSSLLNLFLKENRAIVTDIPGTTRDVIKEVASIGGIPICLADTAGIRRSADPIEEIGIKKTWEEIEGADLVLVMMDATEITDEDIMIVNQVKKSGKDYMVLINKTDLLKDKCNIPDKLAEEKVNMLSVKARTGLKEIEKTIAKKVNQGNARETESLMILNMRHQALLEKAKQHLCSAKTALESLPADLISTDLKIAADNLGEIIGEEAGEDIINRIFASFCIGK